MQTLILNASQIENKVVRIAYEIYEEHAHEKEVVLAGVMTGGYLLAEKIAKVLKKISPLKISLLKINIDKKKPADPVSLSVNKKDDLSGKCIILVDDVLNTGKVLSYSMKIFLQYPVKCIRIAVLVDRNHSLFPVKADFAGLSIATTMQEHVTVDLEEKGTESVMLKD